MTYSIVGAIRDLYQTNNLFLALVLGLFSVDSPSSSFACSAGNRVSRQTSLHVVPDEMDGPISKFSMVEVLFLALLILTVKTLPGGSKATIEWGAYLFVVSALGSMFIPLLSENPEKKGAE